MSSDERTRSSLQRLVPPPDEELGWQQVNRGIIRGRRVRTALVGVAAVMAVGLGTSIVAAVQQDGPQQVRFAGGTTTTTQAVDGSSATPTSRAPSATVLGGGPVATTAPGTPTTRVGGGPLGPDQTTASTPAGPGSVPQTTRPGSSGGGSATTIPVVSPDTAPVGGGGGGGTTTVPAAGQPPVRTQVEDYLASVPNQVRTITDTRVPAANSTGAAPRWVVKVQLRADATRLANDLLRKFDGDVVVYLGFFPYPAPPPTGQECQGARDPSPILPASITAAARITALPVPRGADFTGTVTVTNRGATAMAITGGGTNVVDILLPGSDTVLATYDGAVNADARTSTVASGGSAEFRLVGATASCTGLGGYSLPPGAYDGRVRLTFADGEHEYRFPLIIGS